MKKEKVDRVLSWPEPKNVKDIRKFLGLANYYRRFIKDASSQANECADEKGGEMAVGAGVATGI